MLKGIGKLRTCEQISQTHSTAADMHLTREPGRMQAAQPKVADERPPRDSDSAINSNSFSMHLMQTPLESVQIPHTTWLHMHSIRTSKTSLLIDTQSGSLQLRYWQPLGLRKLSTWSDAWWLPSAKVVLRSGNKAQPSGSTRQASFLVVPKKRELVPVQCL